VLSKTYVNFEKDYWKRDMLLACKWKNRTKNKYLRKNSGKLADEGCG
jgi:hypothetical protein